MRPAAHFLLALGFLSASSLAGQDSAHVIQPIARNQRPLVAVNPFEFAATPDKADLQELNSLGTALSAFRGNDPNAREKDTENNLGKATAAVMTERLLASGNFRVVERQALDQVKNEQQLVASGAAQQGQTVAQQARLVGAKYIITGQITKFGKSKKSRGSGIFGMVTKAVAGVGLESHQTDYEIGITARVVDASTGEVVASYTTDGVAVGDQGRAILGLGGMSGAIAGGLAGSSSTDERGKRIAESITAAVDKLVVQLVGARERGDVTP